MWTFILLLSLAVGLAAGLRMTVKGMLVLSLAVGIAALVVALAAQTGAGSSLAWSVAALFAVHGGYFLAVIAQAWLVPRTDTNAETDAVERGSTRN